MHHEKEISAIPLSMPPEDGATHPTVGLLDSLRRFGQRERVRLRAELLEVPRLYALLMKQRNGARWTDDERFLLRVKLRAVSHLGLSCAILALPGSVVLLPLFAWWLDRRTQSREAKYDR